MPSYSLHQVKWQSWTSTAPIAFLSLLRQPRTPVTHLSDSESPGAPALVPTTISIILCFSRILVSLKRLLCSTAFWSGWPTDQTNSLPQPDWREASCRDNCARKELEVITAHSNINQASWLQKSYRFPDLIGFSYQEQPPGINGPKPHRNLWIHFLGVWVCGLCNELL